MKILYLTNLNNSDPEEDQYLIDLLKKDFEVVVSHSLECEKYLTSVGGIIIRNIWPTHEYEKEWERIKQKIRESKIPTYNPLTGKGDNGGKEYLAELFDNGFPVIPSVSKIEDIDQLPKSEFYYIKPLESCDGFGDEKLTMEELLKRNPENYIIQPCIHFSSEPSFFYINNKFSYAITVPNRLTETEISQYEPTEDDLAFARKFIEWNDLPYGIQRVDAVRTANGKLLLAEVEDIACYLYLLDLDEIQRDRITVELVSSIKKVFDEK